MPNNPMPLAHCTGRPSEAPPTSRRSNQWALQFGDGGGMPIHPPLPQRAAPRPQRGPAGWAIATALAAALAVGIAVELLPMRAPEAAAVDAAAKVVDAAATRIEAAAAHFHRLTQGDKS